MKKIIFLDIDGTLYSTKIGRIPDSAEKAIQLARKNGHKIFLCTGRSLSEIQKYLNYDVDGFILGAGGMVYADGKRIYDHPIAQRDVSRIKKQILKAGLGYCLEGAAGAYCSKVGYEYLLRYFSGGETDYDKQVALCMENGTYPESFGSEENDSIYKICAYGPSWLPLYPKLAELLEKPFVLTKSVEHPEENLCIGEVTNGNVTKGTAILKGLDHYNEESFNAIGIGDSANDIPMFQVCGTSVAMGNAAEEAKAHADYVTTDILDDGIWNAFVYYGLIEG